MSARNATTGDPRPMDATMPVLATGNLHVTIVQTS